VFELVIALIVRNVVKASHTDGVDDDTKHYEIIEPAILCYQNHSLSAAVLISEFADQG
jgi:hypothetical protein